MIERYQTPEMKALWSEARKYQAWALVERLALEAWGWFQRESPRA